MELSTFSFLNISQNYDIYFKDPDTTSQMQLLIFKNVINSIRNEGSKNNFFITKPFWMKVAYSECWWSNDHFYIFLQKRAAWWVVFVCGMISQNRKWLLTICNRPSPFHLSIDYSCQSDFQDQEYHIGFSRAPVDPELWLFKVYWIHMRTGQVHGCLQSDDGIAPQSRYSMHLHCGQISIENLLNQWRCN